MNKLNILIIVYIIGLIFGALILDLWRAENFYVFFIKLCLITVLISL